MGRRVEGGVGSGDGTGVGEVRGGKGVGTVVGGEVHYRGLDSSHNRNIM